MNTAEHNIYIFPFPKWNLPQAKRRSNGLDVCEAHFMTMDIDQTLVKLF